MSKGKPFLAKQIAVVLVEPKQAGNVGAVARAMMNFGVTDLRLVNPTADIKGRECLDRAMTAEKIIHRATIFESTKKALVDCHRVIGTSARRRKLRLNWITSRTLTMKGKAQKTALVFGPEERGLSNADIALCDRIVSIPMASHFPSLNLSHAVTVMLYEIFLTEAKKRTDLVPGRLPASSGKKEAFYDHLQEALLSVGFLNPASPHIGMQEIRNIFARAEPDAREVNILRGLCRQILNATRRLPQGRRYSAPS